MTVLINQRKALNYPGIQDVEEYEYSVVVENNVDAISHHLPMLDELVLAAIEPNIFYEPLMLLPALEGYASGNALSFLLVTATSTEDGSRLLVGFFPVESKKFYHGLPISNLTLWRYPHCFLATPLLHRRYAREALEAVLTWFRSQRRYSLMEFHTQSAHGAYYRQLKEVLQESPFRIVEKTYPRAFMSIETDAEDYFNKAFTGRFRHENRRRLKRLHELGELRWEELPEDGSIEGWIDDFLKLEASGWKGLSGTAMNLSAADRNFFREMTMQAHKNGRLYMLALRLDDKVLAMIVVLLTAGGAYAFKHSYDEEYRRYAPGLQMFVELIRRIHNRTNLKWLDSCAATDDALLNKVLKNRISLCNMVIAKSYTSGAGILKLLPTVMRAKRWLASRG